MQSPQHQNLNMTVIREAYKTFAAALKAYFGAGDEMEGECPKAAQQKLEEMLSTLPLMHIWNTISRQTAPVQNQSRPRYTRLSVPRR